MVCNLFIIDSPLQLLNAIEAREYFQTNNNILVIIFYKKHNQRHRTQIANILKIYSWETVLIVDSMNSKSKFFLIINLIKKLKLNTYNYVFSGNISKSQNAIITSIQKKELYLIDDGTATIDIYAEGKVTNFGNKFKDRIKLLRYELFGITIKPIENMSFFSSLNLVYKNEVKVIKNEYKYLKNQSKQYIKNYDTIYFVGQNFVNENILTDEEYINYLDIIKTTFNNKKIIYLPHREEYINKKYDTLFDKNFEIVYFSNNIEMEFILKNIYPVDIFGFISSALTTIKILFPEANIVSFKPNNEKLIAFSNQVYKYFEENDIKIQLL